MDMADIVDSNHVQRNKALYYFTLGPLFRPTEQAHGNCVSCQETTQPLGVAIMSLLMLLLVLVHRCLGVRLHHRQAGALLALEERLR